MVDLAVRTVTPLKASSRVDLARVARLRWHKGSLIAIQRSDDAYRAYVSLVRGPPSHDRAGPRCAASCGSAHLRNRRRRHPLLPRGGGRIANDHSEDCAAVAPLITRFAPAPTGWLHLGHVLNAEYVWKAAEALSGRVLLRIEDHDRTRSQRVFEAGILDDSMARLPSRHLSDRSSTVPADATAVRAIAIHLSRSVRHPARTGARLRVRVLPASSPESRRRRRHQRPASLPNCATPASAGTSAFRSSRASVGVCEWILASKSFEDSDWGCSDKIRKSNAAMYSFAIGTATGPTSSRSPSMTGAGNRLRHPRRRPAGVDRPADPDRATAWPHRAADAFFHHPLIMKTPDQKLSKSDGTLASATCEHEDGPLRM